MSAGTREVKASTRLQRSPLIVSLLLVVAVFLCAIFLKYAGLLQALEFQAYDFLIRQQDRTAPTDPIVLVEMTESDIQNPSLDYPIHDEKLAEVLRSIEAQGPAVVGLDIWRDVPVPKDRSGLPALNEVLKTNENLVAIFFLDTGVGAPPVLEMDQNRIGFNDNFPVDVAVDSTIPKVRRSFLFADSKDGDTFFSFPFLMTLRFLQTKGISLEEEPDPNFLRLGKARLKKFRGSDGAYVREDDHGWQMLLDFKGSGKFPRFTVTQALNGQIPEGSLRDKIVIVGINTASVLDERVTPVRRDHRGIDVQALTVNQLLRYALDGERPLRTWPNWLEDFWILLWSFIGGAVGYRFASLWRFSLENLVCVAVIAGAAALAFFKGWWIPVAGPALAYIPAVVIVTSFMTAQERSMRAMLMKIYSRHVSKEIAESIWANRDSFLEGHRPLAQKLVVTVLFTDLKGFSTISETMEPPQLYGWLNGYLGAMAQVVQNHGGVLKQFTGDGILALFGVPVPHTKVEEQAKDAAAAVRCALQMGKRLVALSGEWRDAGLPTVSMRAGIYTGEVAAGSVGSDDRFEYAVIGDVVNTASRLESYDKSLADPHTLPNRCRILIGEPTNNLLNGKFVSNEIGLLEVKGKVNKVSVFIISDEKAEVSPPAASEAPK
ncbi:MAG TPA: adenylate/guanylate cyclase domain-containing protein [Candidatus Kapabacteria bacterium]|nr:adenylate/guanylate cyclase domain-containing protein [Candidatus Kapabacteria bacterium]